MDPPKRCEAEDCKRKLALTTGSCKCKKYFCAKHGPAEDHNCTFDYRGEHMRELQKTMNKSIVAQKVDPI